VTPRRRSGRSARWWACSSIPAAVAFYLLVALALDTPGPRIALAATAVVALAFLAATVRFHDNDTEQWRQPAAYVSQRAKPDDVVVFDSSVGKTAFDYYWTRSDVTEVIGSQFSGLTDADAAVASGAQGTGDVWLVVSHSRDADGRIPAILSQSRTAGQQADFVGIRVRPYN
jgi:hypothetical protein